MSAETNPEKRRHMMLDETQRLARLFLPRVILGALLGAAIGGGSVWLAGIEQSDLSRS